MDVTNQRLQVLLVRAVPEDLQAAVALRRVQRFVAEDEGAEMS